jgi:hypothetical protein
VDNRGRFRFEDVPQGQYEVRASAAGYYLPGTGLMVKPGDTAHIVLLKGAVVSGKVVDDNGKPLVDVQVRLTLVNRSQLNRVETLGRGARTDDRGVYRIFSVLPMTYVVSAGGSALGLGSDPYQLEVASYHPSGGRENATEFTVRAGDELLNIDIVHRGQPGCRVSGSVGGFSDAGNTLPSLTILNLATRVQSSPAQPVRSGDGQFEFKSLPDGEYELFARLSTPSTGSSYATAAFASQRVSLRGADATGLRLNLVPLGTISGIVELGAASDAPACRSSQGLSPAQVHVAVVPGEWTRDLLPVPLVPFPERVTADEKWQFRIRSVIAGSYRPFASLAVSTWYVDYVTTTPTQPLPVGASRGSSDNMDFTLRGIAVGVGSNVSGLRIGIAHGGAEIRGRVTSRDPLPAYSLKVYAVPVEQTSNPLRYYEGSVGANGVFAVRGMKPGAYRLIAMKTRENDSEAQALPVSLFSIAERSQLRLRAEKAQQPIDLQPCQLVEGLVVEHSQ